MYAPVIVFSYNRPGHLEKTLLALTLNKEAKDSELFIFIDGPKNPNGMVKTKEVEVVAQRFANGYFKHVNIHSSEQNKGLAHSVIAGVSEVIDKYGKVIVTEDDSVSAPSYLKFMNAALDYYENEPSIWSIGGYTVPIHFPDDYTSDVIMTQRSSSYAWATWKNRWNKIDWDMKDYKRFHWDFVSRRRFNQWGDDRSLMLDDQMLGRVNSWAIRFDYAMFKNEMYNILPRYSLVANIGHDGSGTHSAVDDSANDPFKVDLRLAQYDFKLEHVQIDERIRKKFCAPFTTTKVQLLKRFLGNVVRSVDRR